MFWIRSGTYLSQFLGVFLLTLGLSADIHFKPFDHMIAPILLYGSEVGWLVGCIRLNGLLRQYFSLYRAVSQREEERREMIDERKQCLNNPHPHLLQAQ